MKRVLLIAVCLLAGGCSSVIAPPPGQRVYDLGLPSPADIDPVAHPGMVIVKGPSWLSYSVMQYRLDYIQPSSREVYSESRWVSQPAEMLQRHLVIALGADQNVRTGCQLHIELDEFLQVFSLPQQSDALLEARAELVTSPGAPALARQRFIIRTPAAQPDAAAGVVAHQQGAKKLADELKAWFEALNKEDGELRQRCAWTESDRL